MHMAATVRIFLHMKSLNGHLCKQHELLPTGPLPC